MNKVYIINMRNGEFAGQRDPYEVELQKVFERNDISDLVACYEEMGHDGMTPIPHEIINEMPNGRILLGNNCAEYLKIMIEVTRQRGVEVPFVMIGETVYDTNKVLFDDFYTVREDSASRLEETSCDIQTVLNEHEELEPNFKERIKALQKRNDGSRAIICFGHTHPNRSAYYGTYSKEDFKNIIQYDDSIGRARSSVGDDRAQTLGCMVAANGDVDFMFYDRTTTNFYKFTSVAGRKSDGGVEGFRSYSFRTPLPGR